MLLRPLTLGGIILAATAVPAIGHSPILACYDEGDGTVLCEAGYSDGAPSAGQTIRVADNDQRLILEDVFAEDGTFVFDMPPGVFYVEFEGDTSHIAIFYSEDLVE